LASIAKPTEMEEPRSTEITSKIPPLLLPTSKSINSSRYSLGSKDEKRKGLDELIKLGVGLGETAIGVELGCLLAKRRISQVNKYSENSGKVRLIKDLLRLVWSKYRLRGICRLEGYISRICRRLSSNAKIANLSKSIIVE
jgi:hypothetical protein